MLMRRALLTAGVAVVTVAAAGCAASSTAASGGSGSAPVVLRLGFLGNITHEPALVGVAKGFFAKELGKNVTLRYGLKQHGLNTTPTGGGDLSIKPIKPNSAAVLEFASGQIDGGWEPEPYATEMVLDGGTRLVNEASLWPGGKFVTTNLVVTQSFLKAHASAVNGLLKGQIDANSYIGSNPTAAASVANAELTKLLGKGLKP